MFPELAEASRWERQAIGELSSEADRQILPDGAGAEQAVGYQVFTAELMHTVTTLLRLRGDRPPTPILEAVERSARYLSAVVGESDPAPRYGDDDEGFALRLGPEPVRTVREHLRIVLGSIGDTSSLTTVWLASQPPSSTGTPDLPDNLYANHGGLVVLRGRAAAA